MQITSALSNIFLVVSKYRIEVKPSAIQTKIVCIAYAVMVASVFVWQPNVFTYQLLVQSTLLVLISVYFLWRWLNREKCDFVVQVSYLGEWNYLDQRDDANWWIGEQSKMFAGLLWVQLIPFLKRNQPNVGSSACWCWIYQDRVNEQDYRRLCRCIIAAQQRREKVDTNAKL
ncbi:MAG: protein YgfX [Paraglaciecola polaris]|uniref:protein YgfX n=1 Tax=Paraglaciecola polaris TaxID=222814 RepID=UPI0030026F19